MYKLTIQDILAQCVQFLNDKTTFYDTIIINVSAKLFFFVPTCHLPFFILGQYSTHFSLYS